ncbi:hypothetical protein ABIA39_000708 [Nocardia sp. GAS34]
MYDERLVDQVVHIRGLLEAGLPTRAMTTYIDSLRGCMRGVGPGGGRT